MILLVAEKRAFPPTRSNTMEFAATVLFLGPVYKEGGLP